MIQRHKRDGVVGERLGRLFDPPKQLFYRGVDPNELLTQPAVAVVGSRKMSTYGQRVTEKLVTELVQSGVIIISGLAFGVDSTAHRACLDAGGRTIAVMPSGLQNVYPTSHRGLAEQILDNGGSLLSEYEDPVAPLKYTFVARDRLIAALSQAVIIPEAAQRSGSLHTAQFALDIGIPVLAIPGNITSELSEGTNQLIKTGAAPLLHSEDVLEVLGLQPGGLAASGIASYGAGQLDTAEIAILQALRQGRATSDELMSDCEIDATEYLQTMTLLEIKGLVRGSTTGLWQLT